MEVLEGVLEALGGVLEDLEAVLEAMLDQDSAKMTNKSRESEKPRKNQRKIKDFKLFGRLLRASYGKIVEIP